MNFLRKYNTALSGATRIPIPARIADGSLATSADYTPAAGDSKASIDCGTEANTGTDLAWDDGTLYLTLSGAELTGKLICVRIIDAAIQNEVVYVETYGHASAMYPGDYSVANMAANVTQYGGTAGTFSSGVPSVKLADASHGGGSAVLTLNSLTISTSSGAAVTIATSGGNYPAIVLAPDGTGEAINAGTSPILALFSGDLAGKVLGGGGSSITGVGAWALDGTGAAIATASALSTLSGYVDTEVAAIKAKTDSLTFTSAGKVDANVLEWRGTQPNNLVTGKVDASASLTPLASGTIASTTGTTTTLDAGAVATADYYVSARIVLLTGTGAGQERLITAYTSGRVATHAAWTTNPTGSTTYEVQSARSTATANVDTATIAVAVRDVSNASPAAGSLGERVNQVRNLIQSLRFWR